MFYIYFWYNPTILYIQILNVTQYSYSKSRVNSESFAFNKKFLDNVKNIDVFTFR